MITYISGRHYRTTTQKWTTISHVHCTTLWQTKLRVWSLGNTHSPTSSPTYVIQSQIKWMVVWLGTVSSPKVVLSTCHNCLFIFSSIVSHIRFSPLQPQQHFKGLWNSIPFSSKSRLLVSLHGSKYDTRSTHEKKQSLRTKYKPYP